MIKEEDEQSVQSNPDTDGGEKALQRLNISSEASERSQNEKEEEVKESGNLAKISYEESTKVIDEEANQQKLQQTSSE